MSQHTNKWGRQGYNCKMRPAGSGTTHSTRREQRKALQWDQLAANHQPDTEDSLEKQLEALEKAAQKAKEKMEELKEKKRKEEGGGGGKLLLLLFQKGKGQSKARGKVFGKGQAQVCVCQKDQSCQIWAERTTA